MNPNFYNYNSYGRDSRFLGGPVFPFILGGIAGSLWSNNNNNNNTYYPYPIYVQYPPVYYPYPYPYPYPHPRQKNFK